MGVEMATGASNDVFVLGVFLRDGSSSWDRVHQMVATNLSFSTYIDFRANKVYKGRKNRKKVRKLRCIFSASRSNLSSFRISDQRLIFPLHLSREE